MTPRLPRFNGLRMYHGMWLRPNLFEQDKFIARESEQDDYRMRQLGWVPDCFIDVGMHIGAFSRLARLLWPACRIIGVEPVAENVAVAKQNCPTATIHTAACTYDAEPIHIKVALGGEHSGGSHVAETGRVVPRVTLDELMQGVSGDCLVKLDCEQAEESILSNAQCLDRVRAFCGEWHRREPFLEIVRSKLPDWKLQIFRDANIGLFRLERP